MNLGVHAPKDYVILFSDVHGSEMNLAEDGSRFRAFTKTNPIEFDGINARVFEIAIDFAVDYNHHVSHPPPGVSSLENPGSDAETAGLSHFRCTSMRVRRIAVLIDGAFFLKRLPKLVQAELCTTPQQVVESASDLCKRHVLRLCHRETTDDAVDQWLDHVYRLFYYDAQPFSGAAHHPVLNRNIDFSKSEVAAFRSELFALMRRKRKFALRLGHVSRGTDWTLTPRLTRQVLTIRRRIAHLERMLDQRETGSPAIGDLLRELREMLAAWPEISERDVSLGLRQKGVDMRIGLDIASLTLKHQVDTIVLVTGDSDFVPAAKFARREGVEFLLDPLWQGVSQELTEHVDEVVSVFPQPARSAEARIAA